MRWTQPGGTAVALLSLHDLENNAVRQAAWTRRQGRRVIEIYFKDWRNRARAAVRASLPERQGAPRTRRGPGRNLASGQCIPERGRQRQRAHPQQTAVARRARRLARDRATRLHRDHRRPRAGENRLLSRVCAPVLSGGEPKRMRGSPGTWIRFADSAAETAPSPLVTDLDGLAWRDYDSADKVIDKGVLRGATPWPRTPSTR